MDFSPLQWIEKQINTFSKSNIRTSMINLPKHPKRALIMVVDFILLSLALWISFSLRFSTAYIPSNGTFALILLSAPVIGVMTLFFFNIYKTVTRFVGYLDILLLYFALSVSVATWTLLAYSFNNYDTYEVLPRTIPIGYWAFSIFFLWGVRWLAALLLKGQDHVIHANNNRIKKIAIYGAGVTGTNLAETLSRQRAFEIYGFLDDNPALWTRRIAKYKVYAPKDIQKLIKNDDIEEVILALPSASLEQRKKIVRFLEPFSVAVRTLPAIEDIISGRVSVGDIKLVGVEELLGRAPVPPITKLFDRALVQKNIMVTGAGGTIGLELVRQVLKAKPKKILLFDISEVALYQIEQSLQNYINILVEKSPRQEDNYRQIKIIPLLGSVQNKVHITRILSAYHVQIIFHAAAYKHVPLVEFNPMVSIKNNLWGTKILAEAAQECGVERFVLISTDKAVRPTNIMGASKRLSEMFLQAMSDRYDNKVDTVFTMVRFGNVLDSSGSVVQKFRKQIMADGPVTVTHPDIVRYFMSIPEAAELVIQAGAMAKGGEVYVLDMGEPVKIMDLATSMIRLMGKDVKNENNPYGDIEIVFSGLRPGEKLYEDLLIEESSEDTDHPRILKNHENFLSLDIFLKHLEDIDQAIAQDDLDSLYKIMEKIVTGYIPSQEIKTKSAKLKQAVS